MFREELCSLFGQALAGLDPGRLVADRLGQWQGPPFERFVAIGKAAQAMAGSCAALKGLIISPYAGAGVLQSSHPLLSQQSFAAGQALLQFLQGPGRTLFLLSGGASALVEVCLPGVDPQAWQQAWAQLYGQGLSIVEMNRRRAEVSAIKGGRLLNYVRDPSLTLILSDVLQGPRWVGSGLTYRDPQPPDHPLEVLADGPRLLAEVARLLAERGYRCTRRASLMGGIEEAENEIRGWAPAAGEAVLACAEVTVAVTQAGLGGRCQELALRLLPWLLDRPYRLLVAASDGVDGPTPAAGACVDAQLLREAAQLGLDPAPFLKNQDSFHFFQRLGCSWQPGPSGNNLNDVVVLLCPRN